MNLHFEKTGDFQNTTAQLSAFSKGCTSLSPVYVCMLISDLFWVLVLLSLLHPMVSKGMQQMGACLGFEPKFLSL